MSLGVVRGADRTTAWRRGADLRHRPVPHPSRRHARHDPRSGAAL